MITDADRANAIAEADAFFDEGDSPTVDAYVAHYGEWVTEDVARKICADHAIGDEDMGEFESGGDRCPIWQDGSLVHVKSLFGWLGY